LCRHCATTSAPLNDVLLLEISAAVIET